MALDFCVMNDEGTPTETYVRIPMGLHAVLFYHMPIGRFPLLERLRDYWEDAFFPRNELDDLRLELERYLEEQTVDACASKLREMLAVVAEGSARRLAVEAIAD